MFMTTHRLPGSIIISFILSPASSTACVLWDNIVSHAILQPCNNTNNPFERDHTCMYLLLTSPFLNYPIAPFCNWIHRFPQLTHLLILILSILMNNIYRHRLGIEITQTDRWLAQRQWENEIITNKHKENGNIYRAQKMWPYHVERTFQILETLQKWKVLSPFRIKLGSRTGWSLICDGGIFCFDILKTRRTNENILVFWPYV